MGSFSWILNDFWKQRNGSEIMDNILITYGKRFTVNVTRKWWSELLSLINMTKSTQNWQIDAYLVVKSVKKTKHCSFYNCETNWHYVKGGLYTCRHAFGTVFGSEFIRGVWNDGVETDLSDIAFLFSVMVGGLGSRCRWRCNSITIFVMSQSMK